MKKYTSKIITLISILQTHKWVSNQMSSWMEYQGKKPQLHRYKSADSNLTRWYKTEMDSRFYRIEPKKWVTFFLIEKIQKIWTPTCMGRQAWRLPTAPKHMRVVCCGQMTPFTWGRLCVEYNCTACVSIGSLMENPALHEAVTCTDWRLVYSA